MIPGVQRLSAPEMGQMEGGILGGSSLTMSPPMFPERSGAPQRFEFTRGSGAEYWGPSGGHGHPRVLGSL